MKAIVFPEKGRIEIWEDLELPKLGPNDVEVRTTRSGVTAGTERNHLLGGNYSPGYPIIPGYQQVGRIAQVGGDVTRFTAGQRVYAHFWGRPFVGRGVKGGGHAAARVGPADGNLVALPDDLPDDEASLLSVASIGLHCVRRAQVRLGQKVLVLGLGIIGQFACQAVRAMGGRAFGTDQVAMRLDLARRFAVEAAVDSRETDSWDRLALFGPFDVVVDTTGQNALVQTVFEHRLLTPRGAIVMVGGRFTVEYPFNRAQNVEAAILHTGHHTNEDTEEVIRLRRAGLWQIAPLITHRVVPEQAPEVWKMILAGGDDWLGIVYAWD